tara:strand:- start:321 stop:440 length:120 start_codon:yes stop_codon:yes gene_type:complete
MKRVNIEFTPFLGIGIGVSWMDNLFIILLPFISIEIKIK